MRAFIFYKGDSMNNEELTAMRHSLAHITAAAVQHLWPHAKFGVGPVVENGFYYDIDLGEQKISEDDFKRIEKEMRRIIAQEQDFVHSTKNIDEAIDWAKAAHQPYKEELLNDLRRAGTTVAKDLDADAMGTITDSEAALEEVGFYTNGDFTDLCRGPHVANTREVGVFKLMRVAGAYWRGNEKNTQMQRLYGVAFATQQELDRYLDRLEQAKLRDHRKLGKELDLFTFSDLVGSGLPLYTPRGTLIREGLIRLSEELRAQVGFQKVWSPHITKKELYETSGHWDKFGDELFLVKSQETTDELVMKPMNCPHHAQIYAASPRSYRDLPLKYMETTTNYRDEKTGELHGLSRVRSLSQDDSHTYCRPEQVDEVFDQLIQKIQYFYEAIGMDLKLRLSLRDDSPSYLGSDELWSFGQDKLAAIAERHHIEFYSEEGEAAFYGPKLDFMAEDAIGRTWQVATIQFDFVQPERFELEYIDVDGMPKRPIMVHCAIMGSFDRFFSVFIEHTGGWFPFWVAPEQVRILTINDTVIDYVNEIESILQDTVLMEPVKYNELRFSRDDRNESLGKKIREATAMKIPVQLIVGPKDKEAREVSVRTQAGEEKVALDKLGEYLRGL
jgi:threonyl-tRNA synthetase